MSKRFDSFKSGVGEEADRRKLVPLDRRAAARGRGASCSRPSARCSSTSPSTAGAPSTTGTPTSSMLGVGVCSHRQRGARCSPTLVFARRGVAPPISRRRRRRPSAGTRSAATSPTSRASQEAPPATLALWERYLVYGIAFGIAERVLQGAHIHMPEELHEASAIYWISPGGRPRLGRERARDRRPRVGLRRRPGAAELRLGRRWRRVLRRRRRRWRRRWRRVRLAGTRLGLPCRNRAT